MEDPITGTRTPLQPGYPSAPEGMTMYAVGDIHGRLDLLLGVQAQIDRDKARRPAEQTVEIYLGDYIDRGPDPRGVIARLLERAREVRAVFLRGNHEQLLLDFLDGADCLTAWLAVGGTATLLSYGLAPELVSRQASPDVIRRMLTEKIPPEHRQFYAQTSSYLSAGAYLAVHAGIRPGVGLERQKTDDLLGIRRDFLDHQGDFGWIVIHGHTPVMTPDLRRNRINIDTGAFATNKLSALRIDADGVGILEGGDFRMSHRP